MRESDAEWTPVRNKMWWQRLRPRCTCPLTLNLLLPPILPLRSVICPYFAFFDLLNQRGPSRPLGRLVGVLAFPPDDSADSPNH